MYQGIFDTDFDKYSEDAVTLFSATGIDTVFENLEGFPKDWKTKPEAFEVFEDSINPGGREEVTSILTLFEVRYSIP